MLKDKIKRIRLDKKITIQELADFTGLSLASISMYESGKRIPSIKNINKIAEGLDVEVELLFDENFNILRSKDDDLILDNSFKRANGICELCGKNAPFITEEGDPYLMGKSIYYESIKEKKIFAVCPNCYAKLSILPCKGEKIYLLKKYK